MFEEIVVTKELSGCEIIGVRKQHLQDFDGLLRWIREKGYGSTTGVLKLHLHEDDRSRSCTQSMIKIIKSKCKEKEIDPETKTWEFCWNPSAQIVHKVSLRDNVFQYIDAGCTKKQRAEFVKGACKLKTYNIKTSGCCSNHLDDSNVDKLREHLFSEITKISLYSEGIKEKTAQSQQNLSVNEDISPIIYGAGIPVDSEKQFEICDGFSLSSIVSVLDHLVADYDGITNPYIYCGSRHSFFPWHIEDGGTFSINYVSAGAPKLWFCIPPKYFGLLDKIASGLSLDRAHTSCRALLADHKVLLADPEYFKVQHGVPYTMVLQHPGDFIITFPFTLHAGFNLQENLAISVNFADSQWVEWGIFAPVCSCNPNQVQFDLSNIIKKHRPDLLDYYLHATSLVFPVGHPREVLHPTSDNVKPHESETIIVQENKAGENMASVNHQEQNKSTRVRIKDRTLFCPKCNQSFIENRMCRLKNHIKRKHPEEEEELLQIVHVQYPEWKPKTERGSTCQFCGQFIRGYRGQLKLHHLKKHPKIPF